MVAGLQQAIRKQTLKTKQVLKFEWLEHSTKYRRCQASLEAMAVLIALTVQVTRVKLAMQQLVP